MTEPKALKSGWRRVKFGDVVRLSKARSQDPLADGIERYVGLEHLEPGDLRIRNWGNVADGVTFTSVFQPGQVLFGKRRAYQRKVAVADFSGVCSGDIYVLETKDAQVLLPELLPFICQTDAFFYHAVGTSAGSLSPRTNWTSLADFEFALPPIDEQARRVRLLSTLVALENEAMSLSQAATSLLASMRRSAFEHTSKRAKLIDLASTITSGSRGWAAHYAAAGQQFIRVGNLSHESIELNLADMQRVKAPDDLEAKRTQVQLGDVLLGITGEAGVGRVGIARTGLETSYVSQHIALIRLDQTRADPEFIAHMLASPDGQQQIFRNNQAGAKAGLTLKAVETLSVPALAMEHQRHLGTTLTSIQAAESSAWGRAMAARAIRSHVASLGRREESLVY